MLFERRVVVISINHVIRWNERDNIPRFEIGVGGVAVKVYALRLCGPVGHGSIFRK
jgi:hypothetical protein